MSSFENMFEAMNTMHKHMDTFDKESRDAKGPEGLDWDFADEMQNMFEAMWRFEEAMEQSKKRA